MPKKPEPFVIPPSLPVMVLTGVHLFPHAVMPLFIFEQRYRAMLDYALRGDRIFAIGCASHETLESGGESLTRVLPFSTAGLIRAAVLHDDGTYHVMLQGLCRVRFTGWQQEEPFRIAEVCTVPSVEGNVQENLVLATRLIKVLEQRLDAGTPHGGQIAQQLGMLSSPELVSDFVAANCVQEAEARELLLSMDDVGQRLKLLIDVLSSEP